METQSHCPQNKTNEMEMMLRLKNENNKPLNPVRNKGDNMSTWYETNDTNDITHTNANSSKLSQHKYAKKDKKSKHSLSAHSNKRKIMISLLDKTIQSLTQLRVCLLNDNHQVKGKEKEKGNIQKKKIKNKTTPIHFDVNKSIKIKPNILRQHNKNQSDIYLQNKKGLTDYNKDNVNTISIRPFSQFHKLNRKKVEKQESFSFLLKKYHQ